MNKMTMTMPDIEKREREEIAAARTQAQQLGRNITFIAADGCEVTVTPAGHAFFNIADWY